MGAVTVKVDASGRFVIPRDMREQLGIAEGGTLTLTVQDGELRAATRLATLRRIQRELAALAPPGVESSAVDELIADRRAEAAREEARYESKEPTPRALGG